VTHYLLDTSALLTLRDDEPGADRVAELLALSRKGKAKCSGSFITLMEMLYRVWKDEGEAAGRMAYAQCLSLPMNWIHETPELLERATAPPRPVFACLWRMPGLPPVQSCHPRSLFTKTLNSKLCPSNSNACLTSPEDRSQCIISTRCAALVHPPCRRLALSISFPAAQPLCVVFSIPDGVDWSYGVTTEGGGVEATLTSLRHRRGSNKRPVKEQVAIRLSPKSWRISGFSAGVGKREWMKR
jgi:hypothetical protein